MKIRKIAAILITTGLIAYLFSPYFSAWRMMQAVQSGSAEQMQRYIDFPKVQASIKQQIDTAFEQQNSQADPMVVMMARAFQPMFEKIVEELLRPDRLAELIKSGKLNSQRKTHKKDTNRPAATKAAEIDKDARPVSWYAFLDRPARFRIAVDKLVLYMELQDWQWQMTAIGMDNLLDMNRARDKGTKTLVADEIDNNSPVPPTISTDLDALRAEIAAAFFIEYDAGQHAQVVGDFHYFPARDVIKPEVTWLAARDASNKSVLGQFSKEEMEKREKFNSANQYYLGRWTDELPKQSASDKVVSARGVCRVSVPMKLEQFSLTAGHLRQMQQQDNSAVMLTEISNGNVAFSYYTPYSQEKIDPIIIVTNAQGQPLARRGAFSSTRDDPIEDPRFKQPMHGTTTSISIAGTPESIAIYFPLQPVVIESEFTATSKPDVSFGELKTAITQTRYEPPAQEPELKVVSAGQLENASRVSFHEETNYDKTKKRYIKLTLPDIANSTFARPGYDGLQVSMQGQTLDIKASRSRSRANEYQVYFIDKSEEWSANGVSFDRVRGVLALRYPGRIETFMLAQGESRHGIRLDGAVVTYPKNGDIPDYSNFFAARSMVAYGANKRRITLLDNSSIWDRKVSKLFFWGQPDYVEVKRVRQWLELQIPVDLGINDLQIDKNNPWGTSSAQ